MLTEDLVVRYLIDTYDPKAILFMGSYKDVTQDSFSDFDCAIVVEDSDKFKDETIIDGIQLDCDIFTVKDVLSGHLRNDCLKVHDAVIVLDDGIGKIFKDNINRYLEETRVVPEKEKEILRSWMIKTSKRMFMADDNGNFRAVMLLWESLQNYFLLRDLVYYGSKKSILYLKMNDSDGYKLLHKALETKEPQDIYEWVTYVLG